MHHFFVRPEDIAENTVTISGQNAVHIRQVLRMRPGEEIGVRTGEDDRDIRCRIEEITAEAVYASILWEEHREAELPCEIWLYQGLPKGDKMELIIQKAVELGAAGIVPVACARSVVKLSGGREENKLRRWNAVSESAANQCKRLKIPQVRPILSFKQAMAEMAEFDVFLIPYERAEGIEKTRQILNEIRPGQRVALIIGPEGGFEESEVQQAVEAGASAITLGRRILRTETAGMALLSALMLKLDTD